MMQIYLDDPVYIQTGNPTTRTVNPGKQERRMDEKKDAVQSFFRNQAGQRTSIFTPSFDHLYWTASVLKADLQCMMEEWCSPYSSWLSLMKGCSIDRPPPSVPPPQLLLFEEDESGGSLEVSATGSASPASPFFSSVWRQHIEGCYWCQRNQHLVPVCSCNSQTSNIIQFIWMI